MKIIQASTGTSEQFMDAVQDKIAELKNSDIESATEIDKEAEDVSDEDEKEDIEECDSVKASTAIKASYSVEEIVDFLASKGFDANSKEVKSYAEGVKYYLDMCEKAWDDYGEPSKYTLEQWYKDTQMNYPGNLEELPKDVNASHCVNCNDNHDIDWNKLWEISDRYVTSNPLSGSWDTEVIHEQKAISEELGVSMDEAKHLMIEHLEFPEEYFNNDGLAASTEICGGVEILDEFGIDANELWEVIDKYNTSTPVSGDWDTETAAEQQEIADHFGISLEDAKRVMIDYLGFFDEDNFIEATENVCASTEIDAVEDPDMIDMTYSEVAASEDVEASTEVDVDNYYLHDLEGAIEQAVMNKYPEATIIVDDDGEEIEGDADYEHITELYVNIATDDMDDSYTVPVEDLSGDIDSDVAYVMESVKDMFSEDEWIRKDRKQVQDSDGFYTDYTLYFNPSTGMWVTVFGDADIYRPEDGNYDWEGENEEEAYEWFESYNGFADDDIYSSETIEADKWFYDNQPCDTYWYFTRHGVQPGSWPQGATVLDIVDTAGGSFVLTDKLLTTEALNWFDIKERSPEGITSAERVDTSDKVDVNKVFENVSSQVFEDLKDLITGFEDNLARKLASEVKGYNVEWCEEESGPAANTANKKIEGALADILDAELHVLFAEAPDSLTKL